MGSVENIYLAIKQMNSQIQFAVATPEKSIFDFKFFSRKRTKKGPSEFVFVAVQLSKTAILLFSLSAPCLWAFSDLETQNSIL